MLIGLFEVDGVSVDVRERERPNSFCCGEGDGPDVHFDTEAAVVRLGLVLLC